MLHRKIEKKIRERLVEKKWLKGVVSMPSNIFATTGTNVSVIFIDKANTSNKVTLVDASKLGDKVKEGKNQRTILKKKEEEDIINAFMSKEAIEDFSAKVSFDEIRDNNYSFSAGQYFKVKLEYIDITEEEFEEKMDTYSASLSEKFQESAELEKRILEQIGMLKHED